jgi:uncharacterized lipoprotein YehR (DUF1307 family)
MSKKILAVILSLSCLFLLGGCGGEKKQAEATPKPAVQVAPEAVFTIDNVKAIVDYEPVQEPVEENTEKGTKQVWYHSEPLGKGDIVEVTVRQYSDSVAKETVKAGYDQMKQKRPNAVQVDGVGEDAYIAYPSVHVYQEGYHIQITAGSGADDVQKTVLTNAAQTAVQNLNTLLSK